MRPPGVREAVQRRDAYAPHLRAVATLSIMAFALYLALVLRVLWRVGDEGSIVYGAQRVVEGAVPYRDFFEVIGPGAFYWLAAWFKVLGVSWLTSRLALAATALASAWAIHRLSKRHISGYFAFLPALMYSGLTVPIWPAPNHHFLSNLWVLLAVVILDPPHPVSAWRAALVGLCLGAAATVIPQKGVLLLAAAVAGLLVQHRVGIHGEPVARPTAALILTFVAVGVVTLLFFAYNGALDDLFFANLAWPATQYHGVNTVSYAFGMRGLVTAFGAVFSTLSSGPLARIGTSVIALPLLFMATLPLLALVAGTDEVRKRGKPEHVAVRKTSPLVCWFCGAALFLSEMHRPDIYHVIYGSPLLLVVVVAWLVGMRSQIPRLGVQLVGACVLLIAATVGLTAAAAQSPAATRRGWVRVARPDGALEFLLENTRPGDPVFVYPYYPMYYFLADVRNPTRYSILMYHMNTKPQFQEVLRDLEATQVKYVLWDSVVAGSNLGTWFPNYQEPAAEEQLVEQYLEQHYRLVETRNGFRILQRREFDEQPARIAVSSANP